MLRAEVRGEIQVHVPRLCLVCFRVCQAMTQHEAETFVATRAFYPARTIFCHSYVQYYIIDDLNSSFLRSVIFKIFLQCPLERTVVCESQLFCPRNIKPGRPAQDYFLYCFISLFLHKLQCFMSTHRCQSFQHLIDSHGNPGKIDNSCIRESLFWNISCQYEILDHRPR